MSNDRVAGIVLALFGVAVAFESRSYPLGSLQDPGPGYLPLALSLMLAAFGALVAVHDGDGAPFGLARFAGAGKVFAILAGLAFATLAIESLGYRITILALLVYLLGVVERKHPAIVAGVSLLMAFGSYHLFAVLLRVPLPVGPGGI